MDIPQGEQPSIGARLTRTTDSHTLDLDIPQGQMTTKHLELHMCSREVN